jgi:nitrogenase molybdenum-cofactor synthesis protein NifE
MLSTSEADIMLSGSRTQYIALKAKTAWLDINQERHHPYAGYDGMVELVRQIDIALNNPVWAQVREAAPWDTEGRIITANSVVGHSAKWTKQPSGGPASDKNPSTEDVHYVAHIRKKFAATIADDIGDD